MTLQDFLAQLKTQLNSVQFDDCMAVIGANYHFKPSAFRNGDTHNNAGQNNGSCKIFAFAQLNQLSAEQTLACFGKFYREDVLQHPDGDDHQNIRNFMVHGWEGIEFSQSALVPKTS